MRLLFAIVMVLVLTGASCQHRGEAPIGDADARCYIPCTPSLTDTGVRWEGNPDSPEAWDNLGNVTLPALSKVALTCEERRQACADFLRSLKKQGTYRGSTP